MQYIRLLASRNEFILYEVNNFAINDSLRDLEMLPTVFGQICDHCTTVAITGKSPAGAIRRAFTAAVQQSLLL